MRNVGELQECVVEECREQLNQSVTDSATRQWHCGLRSCVKARGRHFEHIVKAQTVNNCCLLDMNDCNLHIYACVLLIC